MEQTRIPPPRQSALAEKGRMAGPGALGDDPRFRASLELLVDRLIDLLDLIDGDPDREEEEDDDQLGRGEMNSLLDPVPVYGVDQTAGIVAKVNPCTGRRFELPDIEREQLRQIALNAPINHLGA